MMSVNLNQMEEQSPGERPAGYGYEPPRPAPVPFGRALRDLFWHMLKVWGSLNELTFFEEIQGKATWGLIGLQLLFVSLLGTVIDFVQSVVLHRVVLPTPHGESIFAYFLRLVSASDAVVSFVVFTVFCFLMLGGQ